MAFIGGSEVIFLDEPTSGMDPSARRCLWQMIKDARSSRIIILTTHYMDEADFLGDQIAIMSEGRLVCSGSSVFLKNKFGLGYSLTAVKTDEEVAGEEIIEHVRRFIPEAKTADNGSL
jgi:ATP-binding cassette subfamily A (ABC1) protein 3